MHNYLIDKTNHAHNSLHVNPALRRLFSREISHDAYAKVLSCYFSAVSSIEEIRKEVNLWPSFSLEQECVRLTEDLTLLDVNTQELPVFTTPWIQDEFSLLGALYVFHGSKAGATVMSNSIKRMNADLPIGFFSITTNKHQWQSLLNAINSINIGSHPGNVLIESALMTFQNFDIALKQIEFTSH